MKILSVVVTLLVFFMASCHIQTRPTAAAKPEKKKIWTHAELFAKQDAGEVTYAEIEHQYTLDTSKCEIQMASIPVPSPSCTQPPRQDCTGMTGFALGWCQGFTPQAQCNYTAVDSAYRSQSRVYDSCMKLNGWQMHWE